jgi:hypothetical protein
MLNDENAAACLDRRKRLSQAAANGHAPLWGRRFRLPTSSQLLTGCSAVFEEEFRSK